MLINDSTPLFLLHSIIATYNGVKERWKTAEKTTCGETKTLEWIRVIHPVIFLLKIRLCCSKRSITHFHPWCCPGEQDYCCGRHILMPFMHEIDFHALLCLAKTLRFNRLSSCERTRAVAKPLTRRGGLIDRSARLAGPRVHPSTLLS